MCLDLGKQPLAHLDELRSLRCQSSERAQFSGRMATSRLGAGHHEAGNEFRIDPIRLGPGATAGGKGLDLCRRQLTCDDPRRVKRSPYPWKRRSTHTTASAGRQRLGSCFRTAKAGLRA